MAAAKVLIPMYDHGQDPTSTRALYGGHLQCRWQMADIQKTEAAVSYTAFTKAGFDVSFATEKGKTLECKAKMLKGITQKLLVRITSILR